MNTVYVIGGLGNQMFQYAFGYSVCKKLGCNFRLDISSFDTYEWHPYKLNLYNIDENYVSNNEGYRLKIAIDRFNKGDSFELENNSYQICNSYYKESLGIIFDKNVFKRKSGVYFQGYWQTEKYFKNYRTDILRIFTLKGKISNKAEQYKSKIINCNSVSLHIRRGNYITDKKVSETHGVCEIEYYKRSISFIMKDVKNVHFFIFSNDLDWAKDNFTFINNITFIELESKTLDHEEMYLMSQCQHNIIANSTFSWWGAWLNQNLNKIVIAPKSWFVDPLRNNNIPDLIPEKWVCL